MKNMKKKNLLLLISVAVLLMSAVGVTVAYLVTQTDPIVNTFTPAEVGVEVSDEVENGVKKNVTITNTKDVPVYVRVAVVANWCDAEGNPIAYGVDANGNAVYPWNKYEDIAALAGEKWTYSGGYYYYQDIVDVGGKAIFFNAYPTDEYPLPTAPVTPEGHLVMDIIAQGIQAEGMGNTVKDAQSAFAYAANGN